MDRKEILLKEYELCQQLIISIGHQMWTSTTIFMSVNVAILGWVAYGIITKGALVGNSIFLILALGLGIIIILVFWMGWINRMHFLTRINFRRMRDIEIVLGMSKTSMSNSLDEWNRRSENDRATVLENLPEEQRIKFNELLNEFPSKRWWDFWRTSRRYDPPRGFDGLKWIAVIMIIIWAIFISLSLSIYLRSAV